MKWFTTWNFIGEMHMYFSGTLVVVLILQRLLFLFVAVYMCSADKGCGTCVMEANPNSCNYLILSYYYFFIMLCHSIVMSPQ